MNEDEEPVLYAIGCALCGMDIIPKCLQEKCLQIANYQPNLCLRPVKFMYLYYATLYHIAQSQSKEDRIN